MYFPKDMNFQYFFFDTYIGYFLQALPIAIIISYIYGYFRFRKDTTTPIKNKIFSCLFACYITGLICLVVGLDLIINIRYWLIYHRDSGHSISWFNGNFNFSLDFLNNISEQTIGNFLIFLPFGILYPLTKKNIKWKNIIINGIVFIMIIELLQPIFGRAFDINDVVLNILGIIISSSTFTILKKFLKRKIE